MALLQRLELLESERVDAAELRELALGCREAGLLLYSYEGLTRWLSSLRRRRIETFVVRR